MKSLIPAVVVALTLAASSASFAESAPEYHVTRTMALGAGTITVIDPKTNASVATIEGGGKLEYAVPSGTCKVFDPKRKLIFSSSGRDGTLSIIEERDAQTFVSSGSIKTALSAPTMSIDPGTGRIYLAAADVDPSTTGQKRPAIVPGSLKLLILDPAH